MRPEYRRMGGRVKAVVIVFSLIIALDVTAVISDAFEIRLLDRVIAGEELSDATFDANDTRQIIIGSAYFFTWIACAVMFLRWLFRAYHNVDAVAPNQRRYSHGWVIGSWFVPILALFRPLQIVNDVWRAGGARTHSLPGVWWAAWLITNFTFWMSTLSNTNTTGPEAYRAGTVAHLVFSVADIPVAGLVIALVVVASRRLDARAAELPAPAPDPLPSWPPPEPTYVQEGERFPAYPA